MAYKSCAARELYEETGIDLRGSLDRLEPLQLKEPKGKLPCEYKQRIFFSAEIFDHDIALQDEMVALTSSLTQALDKSPPDAMVRSMIYSIPDRYLLFALPMYVCLIPSIFCHAAKTIRRTSGLHV